MPTPQKVRPEAAALDLANTLRPTITRLARRLRQQDHTGLGPTMTAALSSIAKHGGPTHGELAALEQAAPPTLTRVVAYTVGGVPPGSPPAHPRRCRQDGGTRPRHAGIRNQRSPRHADSHHARGDRPTG